MAGYLPRIEEYQLPTPPASVRSENSGEDVKTGAEDVEMKNADLPTPVSDVDNMSRTMFRFTSPPVDGPFSKGPRYRRRFGRNGRLFIEERGPKKGALVRNSGVVYDSDGESDDESAVVYPMDYYDVPSITYRASLLSSRARVDPAGDASVRRVSSQDVAMTNGQATAGSAG